MGLLFQKSHETLRHDLHIPNNPQIVRFLCQTPERSNIAALIPEELQKKKKEDTPVVNCWYDP